MLVELQNVSLRADSTILDNISLELAAGEKVTIIGPNGAGKTSLIKLILGIIKPSSGVVTLAPDLRIGYMPQRLQLSSLLPISVLRFLQLAVGASKAEIVALSDRLKLNNLLAKPLTAVSGGELQRVLLARALLNKPKLLVLDEPAQGVDVIGQASIYKLIVELCEELHCGLLMISHDLHLVIAGTDKVICLNKHICCHGTPETITRHPDFVTMFGSEMSDNLAVYLHQHDHSHD